MTPNKRTIMILQRDLTPEEHDRFMKSTKGEPITSFKVYETNMTNEKEIREQILNTMEKLDMVYRFVDDYENVDEQDKARYKILESLLHSHTKEVVDENTSDGYHTFKELYEFRKLYNAGFFNGLDKSFNVHKSRKHSDGEECFGGGWFIVMATLPTGQISNHYELKDWNLFHCEEREMADKWDGHTPQDVANRLKVFLASLEDNKK